MATGDVLPKPFAETEFVNTLDGSLHGNEAVHQPQEDTHHDENFQQLN